MPKSFMILSTSIILLTVVSFSARADDYYNQKWFDYPDPLTVPRVTQTGCGKQACTDIPEFHGFHVEMVSHCVCINPLMKTELLRRDVRVMVTGPKANDDTVKKAIEGYVAGCVTTAIAASTAGPQVVASPAGFYGAFHACLTTISAAGIAGGILNQINIHIDNNDTHWAPL